MQLKDMECSDPVVLDKALEKIEKLSKNQYFKDMFFRDDITEKFDMRKKEDVYKAQKYLSDRVLSHIPKLMRYATDELSDYFAFCNGITAEEYKKGMSVGKLYRDVSGLVNDEVFANFFYSFAETAETT